MKELMTFLAGIIWGLLMHQTSSVTQKMPKGWEILSGTTFGVVATYPIVSLWGKLFSPLSGKKPFSWLVASYFLAFMSVGFGVGLGWVIDTFLGVNREE